MNTKIRNARYKTNSLGIQAPHPHPHPLSLIQNVPLMAYPSPIRSAGLRLSTRNLAHLAPAAIPKFLFPFKRSNATARQTLSLNLSVTISYVSPPHWTIQPQLLTLSMPICHPKISHAPPPHACAGTLC